MNGFWSDNGTKILGSITAVLGTAQAFITTGAFDKLLSETAIGWMGIILGMATAAIGGTTMARGFNNSGQVKVATAIDNALNATPAQKQGGFARIWQLVIVALLSAFVLAACGGTKALYSQAKTPPQYAKAVLLHANAIGEQIAGLREDPSVSAKTKAALLDGYRATVCSEAERAANTSTASCAAGPVQTLEGAARAYEGVANAQTEAELQAAVNGVVGLLVNLINLVNGAK